MAADERPREKPARSPAAGTPPRPPREQPVLPDVSSDEQDVGWGDEPGERDDNWYQRERPPHHG